MNNARDLEPGSLLPVILERTKNAIAAGVLQPIETTEDKISQGGVEFVVRSIAGLSAKDADSVGADKSSTFLSPEKELYVGDISDTHYCLLNKFNVIDHHLLIITRHFEHQEELLKMRDFVALCTCMREIDSLAFYNAGAVAGASQPHKHLQIVPLPLSDNGADIPMAPLFEALNGHGARIRNIPGLPFDHAFSWLGESIFDDPRRSGEITYDLYVDLLEALGLRGTRNDGELRQPAPYNLLMTRRWMLLVPRTEELYESVSINGLGFAGSLFVREPALVERVREHGPMSFLSGVTRARRG